MILTKPYFEVEEYTDLAQIERAGRTCYKSEHKIHDNSSIQFVANIIKSRHESVLEHSMLSVRFVVDRGVTHELVRHRLMAYSQESTRYCDYKGGVEFIIPPWVDIEEGEYNAMDANPVWGLPSVLWFHACKTAEGYYAQLREEGWSPQQARSVLPNSLKTEIVATGNFRQWRHILNLRAIGTTGPPHPQMKEIMAPLLQELKFRIPVVFDDLLPLDQTRRVSDAKRNNP